MTAKKLLGSSAWVIRSNQIANVFQSNDAAILLGYLCDRDSYYSAKGEEKNKKFNGWFFCEATKIQKGTVCSPHIQRKWFKVFEEIGLIQLKFKGVPPKRYFKINEKVLNSLMDSKCQPGEHLNVKPVHIQMSIGLTHNSNNRVNKNRVEDNSSTNTVRKKINGHSSLKNVDASKYLKLAKKLSNIIQRKKNIKHTPAQIKTWAEEFRKLHTTNKVELSRQKAILKWYKKEIGGQYIPVVESGKSFREKFIKLEDAMNRKDFTDKPKNNFTHHGSFELTKKSTKM